ncbi:MAG: prepilin peptidase [Bacteriovoracaceae bacterium]
MTYLFILITLELLIVSFIDIKSKKISNYWILVNLIIALGFYIAGIHSFEWKVLIYPLGSIILGFVLFLLHIMGAGDSKYLASLFLVLPYSFHQIFLENVLISTILVGGILLTVKVLTRFRNIKGYALSFHIKGVLSEIRSHFSYAPVLLLAWLLLGRNIW